ncbi:MAG: hypothetical protein MUO77_14780 [Anaerolineales bacterium]|nr:hypothetical protein [Anaerolineales bacterium]
MESSYSPTRTSPKMDSKNIPDAMNGITALKRGCQFCAAKIAKIAPKTIQFRVFGVFDSLIPSLQA